MASLLFGSMSNEEIYQEEVMKPRFIVGPCDFTIVSCKSGVSQKSMKERFELMIKVTDAEGNSWNIFEYISTSEKTRWRLKQFCLSISAADFLKRGFINDEDLKNRSGKCFTHWQKQDEYPEAIKIKYYIIPEVKITGAALKEPILVDDDIQF